MNEKKLYKVTIADETGKIVTEVESDCVIAAISDPKSGSEEQTAVHAIYMTNCQGQTVAHTFQSLDTLKREAIAKHPELGAVLALGALENLKKRLSMNTKDDKADASKDDKPAGEGKSSGGGSTL